ncbi:hypothetical protein PTTG_01558 [Puccinia triticina 1-1 BBBD Race 1]|uniref:Uncharacterized protein n=2 Tax=Puccinia triticina TaxID=208348 RepID=A0A0C4ELC4_PUCT1|nr:uncharacterized protein PtA15_9A47 [Puccinia triticina]OAW00226.1 hypothetical protein PTTG_01558 [Puccinia triticina 1-1 BBBD Race 1]WAQ87923.1 hypothetical protein PtA15_9A47 [Puccinia triticina]WAR60114.1 hypothetical protein PtB15_9B51 [Puccinia triticina]
MPAPRIMRHQASKVYKQLLSLSDKYPDPSYDLAGRTRECFRATTRRLEAIQDGPAREEEMAKSIAKAIFIRKEVEALIFLSRYRELKRRYGDTRHSID